LTSGFTVPALGGTVTVTLQDASWVMPGQILYVAGAGGGTTAGDFYVQNKSGNQLTLQNLPASGGVTGGGDMFKAVYDTHNRGYVDHAALADSVPYLGITNAPLASVSGSGLMTRVTGVTTDYLGGDNACHPLSSGPLASSASSGLLNQVSGNTTDFVDGTNHCQNLAIAVAALFGPWTPFTLTAVPGAGTITTQSSNSAYLQIGKTVFVNFSIVISNVGSASGSLTLSGLPVALKRSTSVYMRENAINGLGYTWILGGTSGGVLSAAGNAAPPWTNNIQFNGNLVYETN
jgi:hypothetical protein